MKGVSLRKYCHHLCERSYLSADRLGQGETLHTFDNMIVLRHERDEFVALVPRGSDSWADWLQNFYVWPHKKFAGVGRFHRGYGKKIAEHLPELEKLCDPRKRLTLAGHSAGGGEAVNFAAVTQYLDLIDQTVTFGTPKTVARIYNPSHEQWLRSVTTHYLNPFDMVTQVPFGMARIGKEVVKGIRKSSGSEHPLPVYAEFFADV